MNRIYLIQYDSKDDSILKDRIKSLGTWMNYFPKSWIVESNLTAKQIYENISPDYKNDRILIMELKKGNYWGVMPREAWDWITDRK